MRESYFGISTAATVYKFGKDTRRGFGTWFNSDGTHLASGGADRTICLWDTATGKLHHRLYGHEDAVWSVAFSPDGHWLASGSDDFQIRIWNVETGELYRTLSGHTGCVWSLTFLDNTLLASGSQDETIRLWHVEAGTTQKILRSERPYERMNITGVKGISEAQKTSLRTLGAIDDNYRQASGTVNQ
ncbi:MAG: hypothetical protein R2932_18440 [Caldilineaceae bacterium]